MSKKYTHCYACGRELDERFYTYRAYYLQRNYFDEPDGSDNAFCSERCALSALLCWEVDNVQEDESQ